MRYFPAFIDLDRSFALIVGGGEAAAQKIRLLRKTAARIRVVAPAINEELQALHEDALIEWVPEIFRPPHLANCRLVFATVGDRVVDAGVAFAARARSIPVNVVDVPQLCTFITPAIVDRDPVVVAIGTEGAAPVLAQRIKAMLEAWLPSRLGGLAALAASLRSRLAETVKDGRARRQFWHRFFDTNEARRYLSGDHEAVDELVQSVESAGGGEVKGSIALVGAGPGDPDLLTFMAARALQQADVIVYDALVDPSILEVARRDARRIDVGKRAGKPSTPQTTINDILVKEALAGNRVVRLKGGDPMIFGRAAEEIEAAQAHGIELQIVPGVTSALAAAASAAALVTERGEKRSFTLLTGHDRDGAADHHWQALARSDASLAAYMAVGQSEHLQKQLLASGLSGGTKVTIVERASQPSERIVQTQLAALARTITLEGIKGPAVILIGPRSLKRTNQSIETREVA